MVYSSEVKKVYDKRARVYDRLMSSFGHKFDLRRIFPLLEQHFVNDGHGLEILDLGCGTGLTSQFLTRLFPDAQITGLDYSQEMLKIYSRRFPECEVVKGDFNLPETFLSLEERFDFIVSVGAFGEYGKLDKALPLVYDSLKENGAFVNVGIKRNIIGKLSGKCWHFRPLKKQFFIEKCREAGFRDVEEVKLPRRFFLTNYRKYVVRAEKNRV